MVPVDIADRYTSEEDKRLARAAKKAARRQSGKPWTYVKDARDLIR